MAGLRTTERGAPSPIALVRGAITGFCTAAIKAAHCSKPPDPRVEVETGSGTRLEQLGPEHGTRRAGCGSPSWSWSAHADVTRPPTMSASSR
jgi:hypothetical protein